MKLYPHLRTGPTAGLLRPGSDPPVHPLHILIRCRLRSRVGGPCGIVRAKNFGICLRFKLLRHTEKAIRFLLVANGLLVQALFSQPASLQR